MYHHVNKDSSFITVSLERFDRQMGLLKEMGFITIHTGDFRKAIGNGNLNKKYVMITFDDGWLDNWTYAYPVLKKYGHKAVFFVVSSRCAHGIKRKRMDYGASTDTPTGMPVNIPTGMFMDAPMDMPTHRQCNALVEEGRGAECSLSWDELTEMEASGCIEVQSHTHSHLRWDKLYPDGEERLEKLRRDLLLSKQAIEIGLNKICDCLCWPWGVYDETYIKAASDAEFELLFTTERGTNADDCDFRRLRRIAIGDLSPFTFRKKLFIHSSAWMSSAYMGLLKGKSISDAMKLFKR